MSKHQVNALQLIDLVRQNDVLYNVKHPAFHDFTHKESIWANIDARLNSRDGECKRRWTMLRDAYRRNLKMLHGNPKRKAFKYSRQMGFLKPYFQKLYLDEDVYDREREKEEYYNSFLSADSRDAPEEVEVEQMDAEAFAECLLINELDDEQKSRLVGDDRMSMEGGYKHPEAVATNFQSYFNSYAVSSRKTDVIDAFLLGIGATLRTFTPYHLNIAKQKIFNAVSDLEMEQIRARQGASSAITRVSSSNHAGGPTTSTPNRGQLPLRTASECTTSTKNDSCQEKDGADKIDNTDVELNELENTNQ